MESNSYIIVILYRSGLMNIPQGVDRDADYYYLLNKSRKAGLPTLYYPPEFFSGFKYDKWCDVWSYGVTMFEMWSFGEVSGTPPLPVGG